MSEGVTRPEVQGSRVEGWDRPDIWPSIERWVVMTKTLTGGVRQSGLSIRSLLAIRLLNTVRENESKRTAGSIFSHS